MLVMPHAYFVRDDLLLLVQSELTVLQTNTTKKTWTALELYSNDEKHDEKNVQ